VRGFRTPARAGAHIRPPAVSPLAAWQLDAVGSWCVTCACGARHDGRTRADVAAWADRHVCPPPEVTATGATRATPPA
jgi:hypothetical protein